MKKNKKGFSLIELLAVVIIMGILLLVGVTAVSTYISESRKDTYLTNAELYINATRTMYGGEKLSQIVEEGEALLVPIEITDTDYENKGFKSPYGDLVLERSYVVIVNNNDKRSYYVVALDEEGNGINKVLEDELKRESITIGAKREDYPKIEEIRDGSKTITIDGTEYKVSPRNDINADTVLLVTGDQSPKITVMKIDKETGNEIEWRQGDWAWKLKITLKSPIVTGQPQKYQWNKNGVWEDFCLAGREEKCIKEITGDYEEKIKFRITSLTGEVLSPESEEYPIKLDGTEPECTLGVDGVKGDDDWYKSDVVTVKFVDKKDDRSGVLQAGIGDFITNSKEVTGNHKSITFEGNIKDKAGNTNTCSITFKKNSNKLVLTVSPNGGSATILQDTDTVTKKVNLAITGIWEEDLEVAQYVVSKDNVNEPETGWKNFTNGQDVTLTLTGGKNYLWTKVMNNAGTRTEPRYSNVYEVGYTVAYDTQGGEEFASQIKAHDESLTLYSNIPTKTGWEFQGWSKTKNSKTVDYAPGSTYTENKARTLYAVWKKTIAVTFMTNGSETPEETRNCDIWNNETGCSITSPAIIAKTGFEVVGWNTSETAKTSTWTVNSGKTFTANATYYAITKSTDKITITFNANGANSIGATSKECYKYNGSTSCNITSPTIVAKNNFEALGWNTSSSATSSNWNVNEAKTFTANTTYYAITKGTYTATFNKNNASSISSTSENCIIYNNEENCTITTPTITAPTGYKVIGWNKSATATTSQASQNTTLTLSGNVTYYAIVKVNSYTVTFDANGGTTSTPSKTVTNGETYGTLPIPTRSGYTFKGWYTTASGGTKITSSTTVSLSAAQTLYAQWELDIVIEFMNSKQVGFSSYNVTSALNNSHLNTSFTSVSGAYEKINIPIKQLETGSKYLLCFNETATGSFASGYGFATTISSSQNTATSSSSMLNTLTYMWNETSTGTKNNQCLTFDATASTMYWIWDMSKFTDGSSHSFALSFVSIEKITHPSGTYVNLPAITFHGFATQVDNQAGLTHVSKLTYEEALMELQVNSGSYEKINIPILGLTSGASYTLTFTEKITGSRNTEHPVAYKISSSALTDTNSSSKFSDNNMTTIGTTRTHTLTFTATTSPMYFVWDMSGITDGTNATLHLTNVKITKN